MPVYEPHPPSAWPPPPYPYDWAEPPRRRRLNTKGYALLFAAVVLLCGLFLAVLKVGLTLWESSAAARVAAGAARIATAAADAEMEKADVPDQVRAAVREEAEAVEEALGNRAGLEPAETPPPGKR